jgi:hypothetical protein
MPLDYWMSKSCLIFGVHSTCFSVVLSKFELRKTVRITDEIRAITGKNPTVVVRHGRADDLTEEQFQAFIR